MLQQTQVATVIPFYERWLARFPTVDALAAADEAEVLRHWAGLGYYARARNLHRAAQAVVERHGGQFPRTPEEVGALPGVGPYTRGALLSFAFGLRAVMIDANIARVLARLADVQTPIDSTAGQRALESAAEALLPADGESARIANAALMELGALLCKPGEPPCLLCPVKRWCRTTAPAELPRKKPRRGRVALAEACGWIRSADGALLLEQSAGPRWRGLWRLPLLSAPPAGEPLDVSRYPFTHHEITLQVFAAPPPDALSPAQRWVQPEELADFALTAPHLRAIRRLLDVAPTSAR
ncbi:MAG: A/G-specific adenine glycosylase [Verrucomicrobia bacterium]|nr:A/G-specific adenine glycosylase [Verrucomicrobiota bacterium]